MLGVSQEDEPAAEGEATLAEWLVRWGGDNSGSRAGINSASKRRRSFSEPQDQSSAFAGSPLDRSNAAAAAAAIATSAKTPSAEV